MYNSSYSSYSYMFSATKVTLKVNGYTTEEELLYEGENITFNCSGPSRHQIQLLQIGQKNTFEEQETAGNLPANVSLKYEPPNCNELQASGNCSNCNGSQASGNCSKVVVMTATPEMDKTAYQCRTFFIPELSAVYSRGVYINGNYNPHFRDFSNKTCILYAVIKKPTTSPQQGMCVGANDKEHVFQYFTILQKPRVQVPLMFNQLALPLSLVHLVMIYLLIFTTVITP